MDKSIEVIDLLAHLPYIDDKDWSPDGETKMISYVNDLNLTRIGEHWENKRYLFDPLQKELKLPAHVFSLTLGRLYGHWWLLDVLTGMYFC